MAHIFRRTDNRGQAMVETALMLMFLFVLVFGITEFGRAMYSRNMLNNAARAAARVAVVSPSLSVSQPNPTYAKGSFGSSTAKADCTTIADPIENMICQSLFYVLRYDQIYAQVTVTQDPSHIGSANARTNDSVTVTVINDNFTSLIPGLFGPTGFVRFFPSTLSGSATMRYE